MAFIQTKYCPKCKIETLHTNSKCNICSTKKNEEKIRMWNAMDVDTKLTDLRKRIEELENNKPFRC